MSVRSRFKASAEMLLRSVVACGLASLGTGPASLGDTLLQWDIGQSLPGTAGTTNGSLPVNGAGVIGISGTEITVLGSANGTTSSAGWRWYDAAPRPTDLDGALANSNYFQWSVTTNAFTTATISGLGPTSFSRGAAAPNTLGLVYSSDPAFVSYRVVSPATSITTTASDLAAGLAGDLATDPIVLSPASTGYFRLAYWGATSVSSGGVWIGSSSGGNDFSFTGSFESSVVQRTLSWNGVAGVPGSTWNTSPANAVWLDGTTATGFNPADNAVFPAASDVVVDPAGVAAGTVVVSNENGVVSIGGGSVAASSLSKAGAGRLVLSGSNNFTAGTTVSGGSVQIEAESALGGSAATFAGSRLVVGSGVGTIATPLVAGGGGLSFENAGSVTVSGSVSGTAPVSETSFAKFGAGSLVLAGPFGVQNTAPLELDVAEGSLTLEGPQKNVGGTSDWNGPVTLNGGTLMLHGGLVTGTGIVTNVNPASAIFARLNLGDARFENVVVLNESLTINSPNGRNLLVMAGPISGAGGLNAAGNGAKQLLGANSYAGPTTISGNGALLFGSRASLYGGDTAQWTEANLTVNIGSGAGFRVGGEGQFTAADLDVILPLGSGSGGFLTGSRVVLDTTDGDFAYESSITDPNFGANSRGLSKNGPNTLTLSGANSYSGPTLVGGGGTLTFTRPAALYGGNTGSWTETNLIVASAGTAAFRVGGSEGFTAADITYLASLGTGTTATGFQSGSRIGIDTTGAGGSFTYGDPLTDPAGGSRSLGLAKLGSGTLVLAGDNSYTGGTLVAAGTLQLASAFALGVTPEPLIVDGGVLDLAGYSVKSSGLGGLAGSITNSSSSTPATLTVTVDSGTMTYSGSFDDAAGTLALVKLGGGDLLLTGSSSFSGGTQTAGDIRIAQATSLGTGPIITTGAAARIYWDGEDPSVTVANPLVTGSDLSMALAFAPGNERTVVLTGPISGNGQIKVSSSASGTLDLTNQTAASNTNTGGVEVGTGRVLIDAGENLGAGAVNFGTATNSTLIVAGPDVTVANPITIGSTTSTGSGTALIDTNGNSLTLAGGIAERSGNDPGSLDKLGAGTLRLTAAGTYRGVTTVSAGTLAVAQAAALGSSGVAVAGPGLLALPPDVRLTPSITSLALDTAGGASVDLGAGQFTIAAGGITAADLRANLIAGRNGGAWNGSAGIMSSTAASAGGTRAVGYVVAGDGSARVSFTAAGDVDLSGQVNVFDLVSINSAGKYGTGGASVWSQGDFNYDGVTNVFDLVGINTAAIYGQGNYFPAGPTAAGSGSLAAVPEPTSWTMLALTAGLAVLACRRRTGAGGKPS